MTQQKQNLCATTDSPDSDDDTDALWTETGEEKVVKKKKKPEKVISDSESDNESDSVRTRSMSENIIFKRNFLKVFFANRNYLLLGQDFFC